jgi:RNA recognition motif-containing protein
VAKKLYVGNLSFSSTEEEIKTLFGQFGDVTSVTIIKDRDTGRSRGFGFVEMENADAAIAQLNGKEVGGRTLTVNEAREREDRGGRSGGGRSGGGNRGGFGGGDRGGRSW